MNQPDDEEFYDARKHTSTKQRNDAQEENSCEKSKKTIKYPEFHGHENYSSNMKEQDNVVNKDFLKLNSQLGYIGINSFKNFRGCSNQHLDELHQMYLVDRSRVSTLYTQRMHEKERSKHAQSQINRLELQRNKYIRKVDSLTDELNHLKVEKDELNEKNKVIQRDFKLKQ